MSQRSEIQSGLENISRGSWGKISLKLEKNPRVSRRAPRIRFDSDGVPRKLLHVGNAFVRYRYQERSFAGLRWSSIVDRQVKARILIEPSRELSQHNKSVGQNSKAEQAEDERCS